MKAKKSLGQHFLRSNPALERIADAVDITPKETVIEIGPGHGELTEKLLARRAYVIAVEKDREMVRELSQKFKKEIKNNQMEIVRADIREPSPSDLLGEKGGQKYKVVGNIPYYITGYILRKFLTDPLKPQRVVFLVQKEVAERAARSKKESLLSLGIKAYGEPKYKGVVKAGSFSPPPKVDSAILAIENIDKGFSDEKEEAFFFDILKTGFSQKRKTLLGNLSKDFEKEKLEIAFKQCELDPKTRAENVTIKEWKDLASLLEK
ncbi:MAG: 16S rRNA (adenine(1518)-N(6)/adenine(1519)-N(6))-dimethyltransferase RsmA [Patescibacteria group bacterium]